MKLSVLIISFNTKALTLACVRSVYGQTPLLPLRIIVLDNASGDGSADAIASEFPQVTLVRAERNAGFATGTNLAAARATGDWLLLLNPDTVVLDNAISRLMAFAEAHPDVSIFGGRTLFGDGSVNPASCWGRPTPWSAFCLASGLTKIFRHSPLFAREAYGGWARDIAREVAIVSGCFLLIQNKAWEELGGFDPAFFMYGEDADLCLRAKKLGHKCLICPEATIIHYGGASEKVRADKMVKLFRAKAMLFERHWKPGRRWFGRFTLDLWAVTRMVAFGVFRLARPSAAEGYTTWRSIWARRREWHEMADAFESVAPVIREAKANA